MNIPRECSADHVEPVIHGDGLPAETGTFIHWLAKWSVSELAPGLAQWFLLGSVGTSYGHDLPYSSWMCPMPGPPPVYRPEFPSDFLDQARQLSRHRTVRFQLRQRAKLVLLLHEQPALSNVEAGLWVDLHPDSVRHWRRRWAAGDFALEDAPGRGAKPRFSPLG